MKKKSDCVYQPVNIYTLEERLDGLLDKDALHYPQREDIVIKRFFSLEGVYGRIYWSGKEWDAAEQPVWDRRARHGVTRGSRAGKFCNGFYERNTLIMPKQEYEGHGTVYISNASVRSDRMLQRLRMLKEAGVRWLQLPDAAAGTVRIGDVALPKETLYFPAEIINEKTGRIVLQMEASVDGDGKIRIHFGIRPSYWGWRGELERMYRERLEGLLGMPLEISYKHTKGWLPEREGA